MQSALITAEKVSFQYKEKLILDDINLVIRPREFITIIGPNGAGKSFLLKTLLGFNRPTSGKITKSKELNIGYLPQKLVVPQTMPITVYNFLKLNIPKQQVKNRLDEILDITKLEKLLFESLQKISGGEMQKVLLARALLKQPNLLVLDEPAQNLDISNMLQFYKLIQNIYKYTKIAIIMVSHDLNMVMSLSNEVICMYGHICCRGKPEKIKNEPSFIKIFGEDYKNLISNYTHYHNHTH